MYALNNNYNLGNGTILENPVWTIASCIDVIHEKVATINIVFNPTQAEPPRIPFEFDYTDMGTWEDTDLIDFVRSQPGFEDSTIIAE